jgi:signal transduction histidine kinase/DNA-binding response OmpR family regulator
MNATSGTPDTLDLQARTVLLIDDEPANLGVLSVYLEGAGLEVLVARDGESGLDQARYAQPDLILLDVRLPGIDGFETCRRLKADQVTKDIPVIFTTILTSTGDKIRAFAAGGVDYITKPVEEQEVLARVITHLRLRDLTRQLQEAKKSLEQRVAERTADLARINQELQLEIAQREQVEAEIQRRNRALALLNRIIAASVSESEPEAILDIACRELALIFDIPQAQAILFNEDRTEATVVAEHLVLGRLTMLGHTLPLVADNPALEHLVLQQTPLVVDDARLDPLTEAFRDLIRQRSTVSLLSLPLVIDGATVGVLTLSAVEPRPFSPEEVALAFSVASQVAGVLALLRIAQARQRLEAQYHQAQKMEAIGRLTGGVAHDFNNILTAILGNCSMILDDLGANHPLRVEAEQIYSAGQRAAALNHQLLAFSRQQVLQPRIVNLNGIVSNVEKMLRRLIGEHIALLTRLEEPLALVKADIGQIEQILLNLVVNARDAMPQGGQLTIETANVELDQRYTQQHMGVTPGHYVMLAVSDTGVGMSAEVQARLFEPFFTTKAVGQGTGLGLATCYGIVKQHGGQIWVYSELGHGTTVKVYLPRTSEEEDQEEEQRGAEELSLTTPGGSETVLLVEDERAVRELAARVLRQLGYTVLEAADGRQALELACVYGEAINLLLTDVVIPYGNGADLAAQLQQMHPQLKVLFMSGYADQTLVHHDILGAGAAFLPKPFIPKLLARKVREVLCS